MQIKKFNKSSGFSTAFLLVLVVVLALGLLSILFVKNTEFKKTSVPAESVAIDEQTKNLEDQSSSDEIGAIEKDVNNTNLENLDEETDQIEKDFSSL